MKIGFVFSNYDLASITGQPGIALELAKKASKNHEVFVISNTQKELITNDGSIRLYLFKGVGSLTDYVKNLVAILHTLRKEKPDALHIHGHLLLIFIWFINLFLKIPLSFYAGETIDILSSHHKPLFTWITKKVPVVFVSCDYLKREFLSAGVSKNRLNVVHIGLRDSFYSKIMSTRESTDVLYFGDAKESRGYDRVLALSSLLPEYSFTVLLRWGSEDGSQKLAQESVPSNVSLLFYPYKKHLQEFIEESKVVLLPFRFMGVRPPVSIIEAQALGKCVYTSTMSGNEEVVLHGKTGMLSEFGNLKEDGKIIKNLLQNDSKRHALGSEAQKNIRKLYSPKEYDEVVKKILSHG